jgi:hypothetical protein
MVGRLIRTIQPIGNPKGAVPPSSTSFRWGEGGVSKNSEPARCRPRPPRKFRVIKSPIMAGLGGGSGRSPYHNKRRVLR